MKKGIEDSGGRICVPILYYTNETGEIIYDEEGMAECLKNEIKTITDMNYGKRNYERQ